MQASIPVQPDSLHLDALIAKLKDHSESELLIEHLQTAHAYLRGAMPEEYAHNLELARRACDAVSERSLAGEVKDAINGLLHGLHPAASAHWRHRSRLGSEAASGHRSPASTAKGLTEFFHGSDSSLGIFYPKKHVVAVFPSLPIAETARELLSSKGFRIWEVIALPGYEVQDFLVELRENHSLGAELMMQFSRLLGTEAGLVDCYVEWARQGAGFLIAYSPTDTQAEGIADLLKPFAPLAMHWFMAGYIRHLQ
jgi:hypothetical protein